MNNEVKINSPVKTTEKTMEEELLEIEQNHSEQIKKFVKAHMDDIVKSAYKYNFINEVKK